MELVYLDVGKIELLTKNMNQLIRKIYQNDDILYVEQLRSCLQELAEIHIFFELTRLEWTRRLDLIGTPNCSDLVELLPIKQLTHIPSTVGEMQQQIKRIFEQVLDIDKSKDAVQKRMTRFLRWAKEHQESRFDFASSLPLHFEATGYSTFGEVLYPRDVYDLIEFFLREAVKQEQRMRICKNCGRYFAIARRSTDGGVLCLERESAGEEGGV